MGWWGFSTREPDWDRVADLAERHPELILPSYGLHPWWSRELAQGFGSPATGKPARGIGETGLDSWMEDPDPADQAEVLLAHLDLAVRLNRLLSLHCLRAWGHLDAVPRPARGFLLHSYGGPAEMVRPLAGLGAYFSFAGYFLNPSQEKKRAASQLMPEDRLLIESDAPDQVLPPELDEFSLIDPDTGKRLNDPGNLPVIYRHWPPADSEQVEANFRRFFS